MDPETARLANSAAAPYERYLSSGRQADFDEASGLTERAVARARERHLRGLAGLLFNLSHVHIARYRHTGDRDALGEAYSLMVEAVVLDPDEVAFGDRLAAVAQALLRAIDPTSQVDVRWYVTIHQRLLQRIPGDHLVVWSNLALALRRVLDVDDTSHLESLRSFAEATEHAATLSPPGSAAARLHWDHAAKVLPFLAGVERDAERARRAARACEMAMREQPDDPSAEQRRIALLLARILAYETEGRDDDRAAAFHLLASYTRVPSGRLPAGFAQVAQDVVASLLSRFHRTGEVAAREKATELAIWCTARMESQNDVLYRELPGMLNALGACLAARPDVPSQPAPWQGWRPIPEPALRHVPAVATALARMHPFRISRTVMGPTGKVYQDETFPVVAAEWEEPVKGHAVTHVETALVLPPESGRGVEPVFVPTNLHVVAVTLTAPAGEITGVRAVVEARHSHYRASVDSIMCSPGASAPTATPGALRPAVNLLLDFDRPLVWPPFEPVAVPGTLVVRAVTENSDVRWRLELDWHDGHRSRTLVVPLLTTGETGFRSFVTGGEVLRASGHVIGLIDPEPVHHAVTGRFAGSIVEHEKAPASGRARPAERPVEEAEG